MEVEKLTNELGINELTAKILVNRGINDVESARNFLNPDAQKFLDPFLMHDMDKAVSRIITALEGGETICIYGDYDVDGMSGTTILTRALRKLGGNVKTYIPRRSEGYGLNVPALEKIIGFGITLLISVDCGISNAKEISAVKGKLDIIVTDHHLPALEKITDAVAVVDIHQPECTYPDKNLCGAGVAFKLCQALANKINGVDIQNYLDDIDLAALATVADLVPLKGESRKIVHIGLKKMSQSDCVGLSALVNVAGLGGKKISSENVAFQIAPRLNSVGRLREASEGLKLLLSENVETAMTLAAQVDALNKERKKIEKNIFVQADEKFKLMREESGGDNWSAFITGEGWHAGVIGLTASKLAEKYKLPTVIVAVEGEISRGSCRSIPAFHMKNALDTMAELFDNYGGHSQAAGFSMKTDKLPEFQRRFDEYVRAHLSDADYVPKVKVDALFPPSQMTMELAEEFEKLEPCGVENPAPILACHNVRCTDTRIIGSDRTHLSFDIPTEDFTKRIKAVAFGFAKYTALVENEPVDLTYYPAVDEWMGVRNVKCFVTNIEPIADEKIFPDREIMIEIYKFLANMRTKTKMFDMRPFVEKLNYRLKRKVSMYTILSAFEIFDELGLVRIDEVNQTFELPKLPKRDLENSRTFRLINAAKINMTS